MKLKDLVITGTLLCSGALASEAAADYPTAWSGRIPITSWFEMSVCPRGWVGAVRGHSEFNSAGDRVVGSLLSECWLAQQFQGDGPRVGRLQGSNAMQETWCEGNEVLNGISVWVNASPFLNGVRARCTLESSVTPAASVDNETFTGFGVVGTTSGPTTVFNSLKCGRGDALVGLDTVTTSSSHVARIRGICNSVPH